ncbi:MAG: hypothetical protein EPO32_13045 [Anaerolineae bacterium]|nr:MAG: hypothetical protein EPO32_13045 [Anaerolineae bacterium]
MNFQQAIRLFFNSQIPSQQSERAEDSNDQACTANISPIERRRRLVFGILTMAVAGSVLGWQMISQAHPLWRLLLLPLFAAAAAGYFQWRDKT